MGIVGWVIFGLIAGAVAKWLMPGKNPGGILITIVIGVAGALVGGYIATAAGLGEVTGFNAGSFVIAVGGAVLLLAVYSKIR